MRLRVNTCNYARNTSARPLVQMECHVSQNCTRGHCSHESLSRSQACCGAARTSAAHQEAWLAVIGIPQSPVLHTALAILLPQRRAYAQAAPRIMVCEYALLHRHPYCPLPSRCPGCSAAYAFALRCETQLAIIHISKAQYCTSRVPCSGCCAADKPTWQ